jgi:Ca2+-binding RTX toxin-like protein
MVRARAAVLAIVLGVAGLAPATAAGGTARVDEVVAGRGDQTFKFVRYVAAPGEANRVTGSVARGSTDVATLRDEAGVTSGTGCTRPNPADSTTVTCTLGVESADTFTSPRAFSLSLGDLDDRAAITRDRSVSATIDGGAGNDDLTGGGGGGDYDESTPFPGGNLLRGGDGDDRLVGGRENDVFNESGSSANGSDTMRGGRGPDRVNYGGRLGGVRADLAGDRDDGEPGEGDMLVNAEELAGGRGDDRLTGNASRNLLAGRQGTDVLRGGRGRDEIRAGFEATADRISAGPGDDVVEGSPGANRIALGTGADLALAGAGADRILSRDRDPDWVRCGRGTDTAAVDGLDWPGPSCDRLRRRGIPRMTIFGDEAGPLGGGGDYYAQLHLGCPHGFPTTRCDSRAELRYRGRLWGARRVRMRSGTDNFQVFLFFNRRGDREFARLRRDVTARLRVTTQLPGGGRAFIDRPVNLRWFGS